MPKEVYVGKVGAHTEVDEESGEETDFPEVSFSAEYDFGETLNDLTDKYNEDIVRKTAISQFIVGLRRVIRAAGLKEGSTQESIQAAVDGWNPSVVTRAAKDPVATAMSAIAGMTAEQRDAFKAALESEVG